MNPATRQLARWDKKYVWHPFTQMQDWLKEEPLIIEEGRGCYLKDTQGRLFLDGVSSLWVNVHGHRHPKMDAAIEAQMRKVSHSTFLGLSNEPAVKLAKRLIEIAPKGLTKVFYSDNGSTAVEIALKMSYQYWQNIGNKKKNKIIYFENSYHGDTLGSVSVGGIELFHKVYKGLIFDAVKIKAPHLKNLKSFLIKNHDSVCSVVIEPLIQGAAGMLLWPEGMLKEIRRLCDRYDVFLIADEVAAGFGRTGKMFACEHEGVTPDFMCLAKGLTAGYIPLAATLVTERVFKGFLFDYKEQKTFFHGHTYTANPLACAAALANLDIFKKEHTLKKLQPKIKFLSRELRKFYNLNHVGEVRQKGFMIGIELVRDRKTNEPYPWQEKTGVKVCREAREHGIILRPLGNVIVLMPPLAISTAELKTLLTGTYCAIKAVTEAL
ncbi:MAG TPA: adenosylmethionine--8-amino-7-oxononanoate transaminase [Candidatus Omnitrophota bacterium]|nr:adenosylmethionine--8-amino-7-oxononanoate transaminase [Candidatus Omnitrophota bacterium]HPD84679.1 adenosylmethionine--8-amino-7-oxononanoate transaminase [Candidatus Omnitrophota bacterium]HRZ03537.1 adenosylmethionine--8-amino-7-oxononanoate transaminase [Candidatus Omnitrophota bacterium]